jgi:flagellar biosynthesis component FlhA
LPWLQNKASKGGSVSAREIYATHAQCVIEKFVKNLWGKDKIQATLERLDQLTKDEEVSAVAQTLGVVHGIADNMRVVMGGVPYFRDFSQIFV